MPRPSRTGRAARRLGWFVALWAAGVGTVAAAAYALRWWLVP